MAEVNRPGLRAFLEGQIAKVKLESGGQAALRIVDDPAHATSKAGKG